MKVTTEWHPGAHFAEFAEALGIPTKQILAAKPGEPILVLYTPDSEEELDPGAPVFGARLDRDEGGILRQVGEPILMDFDWDALHSEIERKLAQHFDR